MVPKPSVTVVWVNSRETGKRHVEGGYDENMSYQEFSKNKYLGKFKYKRLY